MINMEEDPIPSGSNIQLSTELNDEKVERYTNLIRKCENGMSFEAQCQELLKPILCKNVTKEQSMDTPYLLTLERTLLNLSSYPDCTAGILYAMPIIINFGEDNKILFVRCFESGVFKGFFKNKGINLLESMEPFIDVLFSHIYTQWDSTAVHTHRNEKSLKRKPQTCVIFKNLVHKYKTSIANTLPFAYTILKNNLPSDTPGYLVYCQRSSKTSRLKDISELSYFNTTGLGNSADWDAAIKLYMSQSSQSNVDITENYCDKNELTLREQFEVISLVPNLHHWLANRNHGVKMDEYFIPLGKSPRNQIIKSCIYPDETGVDVEEIQCILKMVFDNMYHIHNAQSLTLQKNKNKIIRNKPKPRLCVDDILNGLGMTNNDMLALQEENEVSMTLYENFKANINLNGTLKWRLISPTNHTVVMNDYDCENGKFKLNDFVIVTHNTTNEVSSWFCTCETYRVLMSTVRVQYDTLEWNGLMCCHCRLLQEFINEISFSTNHSDHHYIYHETIDAPENIKAAIANVSLPVVILASANPQVTKYSIVADNDVQFVHIFKSDVLEDLFISCQSGLCQHSFGKKRTLKRLDQAENICKHLKIFKEWQSAQSSFGEDIINDDESNDENIVGSDYDDDDDNDLEDEFAYDADSDIIEFEGELDMSKWKDCFNPDTGLWKFRCAYGRDVSRDQFNEKLTVGCANRQLMCAHYLHDFDVQNMFLPSVESDMCSCELPWSSTEDGDIHYSYSCQTNLYTKLAVLPCDIYKLVCQTKQCCLIWDGSKEQIFRISSQVCAGEELCWDYIEMVTKMKCTFSAFCDVMTVSYLRHNPSSKGFMSPKTFRNLFFSWASYQKIDFRQMCEWCGPSPSVLSCDATKIGVAFKNCSIPPIERPSSDDITETPHRRYNRCFLTTGEGNSNLIRESRKHMKLIMSSSTGYLRQESLSPLQLSSRNSDLVSVFPQPCKALLLKLLNTQLSNNQMKATTKLFYMLSFDAPLRSFIPQLFIPHVQQLISDITNSVQVDMSVFFRESLKFNPILGNFTASFYEDSSFDIDALAVLSYLTDKTISVHEHDIVAPEPTPLPGTYNPPRLGRAYYFTQDGLQLRDVRKFSIDDKGKSKKTHDDIPINSKCTKRYPVVAMKGSTFLFLWFCPMHGHCYGFHIVNGSEGRKDPCFSLYTHLTDAPDSIFYDFACSLEEYCLNRESQYYKNTRFFHDVFHGYSHTCSSVYSSRRLLDFRSVNTSLCEQFNSFLQCIKASAKHMSQVRFIFYVQFMINIWNERKKASFKNKLKVAASGGQ